MEAAVRFAPSLAGRLTVAGARLALANWLHARRLGAGIVLRLDDVGPQPVRADIIAGVREDLRWLGLTWDAEASQSERADRYERIVERLRSLGRLYPCWETPAELEERRRRQIIKGQPAIYDRASLLLPVEVKRQLLNRRKAHWRFYMEPGLMKWNDLVLGDVSIEGGSVSDPIVVTDEGAYTPFFMSMVDDIDLGVSDVVRGDDQAPDTVPQLQMFEALRIKPPRYGHLPGIVEAPGQPADKPVGPMTVAELREAGVEAMVVASLLAKLGTPDPPVARLDLDKIADDFDLNRFGRVPVRLDAGQIDEFNRHVLRHLPFAQAAPRLRAIKINADEAFWLAVRPNLRRFADVQEWWRICRERVIPRIDDAAFVRRAGELLPPEPWNGDTCRAWAAAVQARTGRHGWMLLHPLRLALTGRAEGPDLQVLLPLIGRDRASARLRGETI